MSASLGTEAPTTAGGLWSLPLYRFTVDEYERLAAAGILRDRRITLIQGYLVRKMTTNPPHVLATEETRRAIERILPAGWHVRQEQPLRIPDHDEPEPDVVIARGSPRDYATRHPGPTEIALVVEVADSSLMLDRGEQLATYARAGIPVYWIINLVGGTPPGSGVVEVYTGPTPSGGYLSRTDHRRGDEVPVTLDGREIGRIPVTDMLP
ncbi:MAG: Uma2 family endonuclease [Isosphaeraceae bacterium]